MDDDGLVKDLVIQRQNMARCLIEEVMVAANGTMVSLPWQGRYSHDTAGCPRTKYWEEIVNTAASYGETLPAEPDAKALSKFLIRQKAA